MTKTYRYLGVSILISLLISVYTFTNAGRFHIIDEVSVFALTESVALHGTLNINQIAWSQWVKSPKEVMGSFGTEGDIYPKKGPAPSLLAVPWYWLLRILVQLPITFGVLQGTMLWHGIITALSAGLLWLTAIRLGYGDRTAGALALLFGLCTIAWPYANHLFGEPVSALGLLACYYGILSWQTTRTTRWLWFSSFGAALAVAAVTVNLLLVAEIGLFFLVCELGWCVPPSVSPNVRLSSRPSNRFIRLLSHTVPLIVPLLLMLLVMGWYNAVRFGSPFDVGYNLNSGEGFVTPIGQGAWGLLISPYRGLFWHTPLFLVSAIAFVPFMRRHRGNGLLIAALSLTLVGIYSMWWMWWGGFAWGPRFLVPLSAFWVLLLAPIFEPAVANKGNQLVKPLPATRWRTVSALSLWLIILLSFVIQLSAVSINYVNYETQLRSIFPTDDADPLVYGPPAQKLSDWEFSPVLGQWRLLAQNFAGNSDLVWLRSSPTGKAQMNWALLACGLLVIGTLSWLLRRWWRQQKTESIIITLALTCLLPIGLMGVWLQGAASDPHYGEPGRNLRGVLETLCPQLRPGDIVVTVAPFRYQVQMNWHGEHCPRQIEWVGFATSSATQPDAEAMLQRIVNNHQQLWFITGGLQPNEPDNSVERWLAEHAFKADDRWFDDFRLLAYATSAKLNEQPDIAHNQLLATSGNPQVKILSSKTPSQASPGTILPVEIHFNLETAVTTELRWFVQLLASDGAAVALLDTAPDDNYSSFTSLPVGAAQIERAALYLPQSLPPATYRLIAGLYNAGVANAPRLNTSDGQDFVVLGDILIE